MTDYPGRGDDTEGSVAEPAREGSISRRGLLVAGIATGAAVVWSAPFPFADAIIGQGIAQAAGPTGPTGPTGPAEQTGATGTAVVPTSLAGSVAATGATGSVKKSVTLHARHTATRRRVHPGQWFGQTIVVTGHGSKATTVTISMPTPSGLVRVAGKATRKTAVLKPGHSLRFQTVYIAKPESVGHVVTLRPRVTADGIPKITVAPIHVTVIPG